MPCRYLDCDHEQLVENQDCIAHSNHSLTVDLGQNLREALDYASLVDGDKYPDKECAVGKRPTRRELLVQLGVEVGQILIHILVENKGQNWRSRVHRGVADEEPVLKEKEISYFSISSAVDPN
jgi:hypothetical protein